MERDGVLFVLRNHLFFSSKLIEGVSFLRICFFVRSSLFFPFSIWNFEAKTNRGCASGVRFFPKKNAGFPRAALRANFRCFEKRVL